MAARGRKPFEDELRLRERIESLYWSGLRPAAIRDALASAQNPTPITLSLRQVQAHVTRLQRGWVAGLDPARREAERAELVAASKDVIRVAAASSARYRDTALGVGYLNSGLRAIALVAKLHGFNGQDPTGCGGPAAAPEPDTHPLDGLAPAEQAARFRQLADTLEEPA